MHRREPLRVVCYAVNGTGVGHITRLLAIARWLRRYAGALDERLEVWFLTSSEAEGLAFAEGFAAFKVPSKTVVREAGIDHRAYLALAKQWIWHTLGLLRPDLLIVDTFPRGSFGELLGALDLCRKTAFVYRPVRPGVAERADFQAMVGLYDLVLVPDHAADAPVPEAAKGRRVHVGPVLGRERWELLPREDARAKLGVPAGATCVYVSAGGGGDPGAELELARAIRALSADASLHVVVGTGALYRGQPFPGITVVPGRSAEWCLGFDAAVSAAGYNTFSELMFAGVPTAFAPQHKLADDQAARAELAVRCGAGALLAPGSSDAETRATIHRLAGRAEARDAARGLVPENCARVAAAELMRLVVPPAKVDLVEEALDDARLAWLAASAATELDALGLAHRLAGPLVAESDGLWRAVVRSVDLLARAGHDARSVRELRVLVDAVARGLPSASIDARADACDAALAELGPLVPGDGGAAHAAVADGRWGALAAAGATDGAALAQRMRRESPNAPTVPPDGIA